MDGVLFFRNLGFSEYESKVLVCLVKLGGAVPKEISLDSDVPQNKIYSILRKFEELGILSVFPGEPKKYALINLESFIGERINEKESELRELRGSLKELRKMEEREEQFVFSLIRGQRAIMNKLVEVNSKVRKEIFGVQRNWKYWGNGIRAMEGAIKRGVDVRCNKAGC